MSDTRNLPTYNANVGIQVTDQPDPNSAASSMINAFRSFSEGIAGVSQSISDEQAKQQREILKNNISNAYRGFALEALKNPDQNAALVGFNDSSRSYAKQLLEQTDSFNKPYVSNLVDYYHNEHQFSIEKNAIMQNKRVAQVNAYDRINTATIDWKNAINNSVPMTDEHGNDVQFDAATALFTQQIKNMETDGALGNISPERLGVQRQNMQKDFISSVFLKKYEDHVQAGQGNAFIKQLQAANYNIPGFSIEDKTKLIGEMIRIRDQGQSGARLALGQLKNNINFEIRRVTKGGMPNDNLMQQVSALDENAGHKLSDDIDTAQQAYSNSQAALYKTPEEVEKLKTDLKNIDPNSPNFDKLTKVSDASIKAIDEQTKEFRLNPMEQTMKDPAISDMVNNYQQAFNANSVGTDHKYTPFNSIVQKPWDAIIQSQLHRGLTLNGKAGMRVRLLDNSQVPDMINAMMQSSPRDKITLMNKWNEEYGGGLAFNLVMKQLVDGGMPPQFALLANIDPNSKDAADVSEAVSVPYKTLSAELNKKDNQAVKNINNSSMEDVFGAGAGQSLSSMIFGSKANFGGTDSFKSFMNTTTRYSGDVDREYFNNIATTVQQLAYYYSLTQNMSDNDAVKKAEDVIGSRYDYTIINNKEVRMPLNLPAKTLQTFASEMEKNVSSFNFNTKGYDKDYAKTLISQGYWKNDNTDNGLVWVDANGKLWTDKNGHPFGFSFDEARTGMENPRIPETKKVNQQTEQNIDQGDELANIDRIGAEKIAAAKRIAANRSPAMKAAIGGSQ